MFKKREEKLRKALFLLLLIVLIPAPSRGESLRELQELALKNYPALKELSLKAESLKKEAQAKGLKRWGTVTGFTELTDYSRDRTLYPLSGLPTPTSPPPFDSQKLSWGVSYRAKLFPAGVYEHQKKALLYRASSLEKLKLFNSYQVKSLVSNLYFNYLALKESEKALKEELKSLKRLKSSIGKGIKAGKLAEVDLLKVARQIKEVEAKLAETDSQLLRIKRELSVITGKRVEKIEGFKVAYSPGNLREKELKELLYRSHLIGSKREELKEAVEELKLSKASYGLQLEVRGTLFRVYGFDSHKNEGLAEASLLVSYPLFEFGRKKRELLAKALKELSYRQELKESELELLRRFYGITSQIRSVEAQVELSKEELKLSEEVERIEELKYLSGKGDLDHLLLARSKRYLAQAKLQSLYYRWEALRRELLYLLEVNCDGK
jgi:outer membrane protein TolC